ncbi:hypothetical protein SDC9_72544 [bioreactor metagenome]|uniref:Flp/Fap pilin component n=1 Tax=bioreactor metagenome TaxID=1076179 RepID=A0A644YHT1_9ZZZZ
MEIMKRLFTEEEGQGLVEYVMIIAVVVAIGLVVTKGNLGNTITTRLQNLVDQAAAHTGN